MCGAGLSKIKPSFNPAFTLLSRESPTRYLAPPPMPLRYAKSSPYICGNNLRRALAWFQEIAIPPNFYIIRASPGTANALLATSDGGIKLFSPSNREVIYKCPNILIVDKIISRYNELHYYLPLNKVERIGEKTLAEKFIDGRSFTQLDSLTEKLSVCSMLIASITTGIHGDNKMEVAAAKKVFKDIIGRLDDDLLKSLILEHELAIIDLLSHQFLIPVHGNMNPNNVFLHKNRNDIVIIDFDRGHDLPGWYDFTFFILKYGIYSGDFEPAMRVVNWESYHRLLLAAGAPENSHKTLVFWLAFILLYLNYAPTHTREGADYKHTEWLNREADDLIEALTIVRPSLFN